METGWSHWAVASAALATRRALTVTAKVGSSGRGYGVQNQTATLSPSQIPHPCPFLSISSTFCHRLRSSTLFTLLPLLLPFASLYLLSFYSPLWLSLIMHPFPAVHSNTLRVKSISISCCWDGYKVTKQKQKGINTDPSDASLTNSCGCLTYAWPTVSKTDYCQ